MALSRNFRVWTRRWWAEHKPLPIDESIQPVVIVDDVSSLQIRPLNMRFNSADSTIAFALQHGTLILRPRGISALRVESIRATATGRMRWGVLNVDQSPIPTLNNGGQANPQQNEGPPSSTLQWLDAIQESGTTATLMGDDNIGSILTSVREEIDSMVLPGQYFFVQNETQNQIMTIHALRWEEIPSSVDQVNTSSPLGAGGIT